MTERCFFSLNKIDAMHPMETRSRRALAAKVQSDSHDSGPSNPVSNESIFFQDLLKNLKQCL